MRLLQFTDMHLPGAPDGRVRGVVPDRTLARCLAHARARQPAPAALLLTGDLVQDDAAAYPRLRAAFAGAGVPVHCLPGNHDDPTALRRELAAAPFVHDFACRYGDWLLVLLDTTVPGRASGHLGADALERLRATLGAHAGAHVLVCLHHHPVAHGSRWLDALMLDNAAALFAVLEGHPGVRGLLWGHVHQELDRQRGPWRLLATPSTCVQFRPGSADFAVDDRPPAYRWLELGAAGDLATGIEWVAGDD